MESAVSIVLGRVGNLALQETKFLRGVDDEVIFLKAELMRLQGFLQDAESKRRSGNESAATFLSQIRDAAYEAENVIEDANCIEKRNMLRKGFMGDVSRYAHLPRDLIALRRVGVQIKHVKRKINDIFQSAERLKIIEMTSSTHVVDEPVEDYDRIHQNLKDDVVMVGFENEHKEIVDKLLDEEKMLSVVSIVAMGGAGKTTLARKVYTSSKVKQHFEVVTWVTVSQKFKVIDLLKEIMKQIILSDRDESRKIDEKSEYELGNKIHDILLQKRYLVVLDDVWESDTWEQLNTTVKSFPDANNGSRLMLTTRKEDVANHVQMPTHVHALKLLDEDKSWELFSSKALPSYARLRLGMHVLDKFEKLGNKLSNKCGGLPLALAVLGGYLSKNLNIETWLEMLLGWSSTKDTSIIRGIIARSYKDLPNHYLRSCLLYLAAFPEDYSIDVDDLIRLWIAESFIPRTRNHTLEETGRRYVSELAQRSLVQFYSGYSRLEDKIKIHDIIRDWCIEEATQDGFLDVVDETTRGQVGALPCGTLTMYRYSFQNVHGWVLETMPNLRTLLGFGLLSVSFLELRFIRVLRIDGGFNLKDLSKVIGRCVHLRYLGLIDCGRVALPSSIGKLLVYLQTIDTKGSRLKSGAPISSLWDIPALRYARFHSSQFSLPRRAQIPQNLRELHITALGGIKEDPMPVLEKFPCLVVLSLYGWENKNMDCSAQGFPCLQKLRVYRFSAEKWTIESGAMPNLNCLKLYKCEFTGGIPEGLLELPSLGVLFLYRMGRHFRNDLTVTGLLQKGCEVYLD